jgi:hypothetical protein
MSEPPERKRPTPKILEDRERRLVIPGEDVREWRRHVGLSERDAGERMGMSRGFLRSCEALGAPLYIGLAMAACANKLQPFSAREYEEKQRIALEQEHIPRSLPEPGDDSTEAMFIRVERRMERLGKNQQQVSLEAGMSRDYLRTSFRQRSFGRSGLANVAIPLRTSVEWLLRGEGPEEVEPMPRVGDTTQPNHGHPDLIDRDVPRVSLNNPEKLQHLTQTRPISNGEPATIGEVMSLTRQRIAEIVGIQFDAVKLTLSLEGHFG